MQQHTAITSILRDPDCPPQELAATLAPYVLDDLRRMAQRFLRLENPGHTLQPTAVVNEVYLRLTGCRIKGFDNRQQFFAFASRLVREVLVDHARGRRAARRGGGQRPVPLEAAVNLTAQRGPTLEVALGVHAALECLEARHPRKARLVELRYFIGLTLPEAATVMGVSLATAERDWAFARRWLAHRLRRPEEKKVS